MASLPIEQRLKAQAHAEGFELAGITRADEPDGYGRFAEWLRRGYAGEMNYLHFHAEQRRHPRSVLPEVRSVLMVALPYGDATEEPAAGNIAKYARGPDYHRDVWDRLNRLADWLECEVPGASACGIADTAPLLERDYARRAGLGWFGKNTLLINPRTGSFFFLGALLTSLELESDAPFEANHCGTCTACLDACPTGALVEPGWLDARKCISYLTIELRGPIPEELRPQMGEWLFGCDVCQDVCPWNAKPQSGFAGVGSKSDLVALDAVALLSWTEDDFRRRFRGTVLFRSKRRGLLRNAAIVLGNRGDPGALPALCKALEDPEPLVREAAEWAIQRIQETSTTRGNAGALTEQGQQDREVRDPGCR